MNINASNFFRGKFGLEMSAKAIKFIGPSNTYNSDFRNIDRAFLLPKENGKHVRKKKKFECKIKKNNFKFIVKPKKKFVKNTINVFLTNFFYGLDNKIKKKKIN